MPLKIFFCKFRTFCFFVLTFKTTFVHNMLWTCIYEEFNEQSLVIMWAKWFKNESFWKRFTCTDKSTTDSIGSNEDDQNHTKSFKRQPTTGSLHNDQDIKSFQDNLEKKAKPSNLSSELNNHHDTSILGTLLHMINVN